jgi:hypothetical protein
MNGGMAAARGGNSPAIASGGLTDLTQRREGAKAQREKQKLGKQRAEMLIKPNRVIFQT